MMNATVARITEIGIGRHARTLAVLRWSDYALVVVCGLGAIGMLPDLVLAAGKAQWPELVGQGLLAAVLAFAAFTGWRHVGVIDPRVWRSYLWIFPLLAAWAVLVAFAIVVTWASQEANAGPDNIVQRLTELFGALYLAGVAMPGFVCVLLLRRMRIAPMGVRLGELLAGLGRHSGASGLVATKVERISLPRGLAYGAAGAAVLLGAIVAPFPTE